MFVLQEGVCVMRECIVMNPREEALGDGRCLGVLDGMHCTNLEFVFHELIERHCCFHLLKTLVVFHVDESVSGDSLLHRLLS